VDEIVGEQLSRSDEDLTPRTPTAEEGA